jgi:ribosome-binding factor A
MNTQYSSEPFTQRQLRVGELLKQLLGNLFLKEEISLPNINTRVITITEVRMSPDLKHAKVFFMPLGGINSDNILKALIENSLFIKHKVSKKWINKFLPSLHFVLDKSFDYAEKIEKLISDTHKNDD